MKKIILTALCILIIPLFLRNYINASLIEPKKVIPIFEYVVYNQFKFQPEIFSINPFAFDGEGSIISPSKDYGVTEEEIQNYIDPIYGSRYYKNEGIAFYGVGW